MASLYHSSLPISPPPHLVLDSSRHDTSHTKLLLSSRGTTNPTPISQLVVASSFHGILAPTLRTTQEPRTTHFTCHTKTPNREDLELLHYVESNGSLHKEQPTTEAARFDLVQEEEAILDSDEGNGRFSSARNGGFDAELSKSDQNQGTDKRNGRLRARDCVKKIMELPVEERVKVLDLLQCDDKSLTISDYNDILYALVRAGDYDSAVALFNALESHGISPDCHSFSTIVQCLCKKDAPEEAKSALDAMVQRGFQPNVVTFSAVVNCLCKRGRVTKAFEVFETMRLVGCEPTIRTYNSLISGLCYVGRLEEASELLKKLKNSPKTPDIYTFTIVLDGFCKVGRTDEAMEIFREATEMNLSPTIFTYNALLNGYCKEGNPMKSYSLLLEMQDGHCLPDKISFSIVLQALLRAGEICAAWETYKKMEKAGFEAEGRAMDTLIRGLCRQCATNGEVLKDAKEVFMKTAEIGYEPMSYTYCLMAQALARGGEVDEAVACLQEMVKKGYSLRKRSYTDIVRALCDRGRVYDALRVLSFVIMRDFVPGRNSFDAVLSELSRQGKLSDALAVYGAAMKRGVTVSWKQKKVALVQEELRNSSVQIGIAQ